MTRGTDSLRGDLLIEGDAECWQVQVAVDAAEPPTRFVQASGETAQRHGAVVPVLHVHRVGAAIEIIDYQAPHTPRVGPRLIRRSIVRLGLCR